MMREPWPAFPRDGNRQGRRLARIPDMAIGNYEVMRYDIGWKQDGGQNIRVKHTDTVTKASALARRSGCCEVFLYQSKLGHILCCSSRAGKSPGHCQAYDAMFPRSTQHCRGRCADRSKLHEGSKKGFRSFCAGVYVINCQWPGFCIASAVLYFVRPRSCSGSELIELVDGCERVKPPQVHYARYSPAWWIDCEIMFLSCR
jgi:hypothetical protein